MNSTDFCFWLQGFVEIVNTQGVSDSQWEIIKNKVGGLKKFEKESPDIKKSGAIYPFAKNLPNFDWYPEDLRKWNAEHPGEERAC